MPPPPVLGGYQPCTAADASMEETPASDFILWGSCDHLLRDPHAHRSVHVARKGSVSLRRAIPAIIDSGDQGRPFEGEVRSAPTLPPFTCAAYSILPIASTCTFVSVLGAESLFHLFASISHLGCWRGPGTAGSHGLSSSGNANPYWAEDPWQVLGQSTCRYQLLRPA